MSSNELSYYAEEKASLVFEEKVGQSRRPVVRVGNSDSGDLPQIAGVTFTEINPFEPENFSVDYIEAVIRYYTQAAQDHARKPGIWPRIEGVLHFPFVYRSPPNRRSSPSS